MSARQTIGALTIGALAIIATPDTASGTSAHAGCGRYHGRAFIVCRESGPRHMPNGLPAGTPHPGPSSASGPCGMLAATRARYGGDSLAACARYMRDRYGSWSAAERHHRAHGWW